MKIFNNSFKLPNVRMILRATNLNIEDPELIRGSI